MAAVVMEEHVDSEFEPSQKEIEEYGEWLGMNLKEDECFLWIARDGLKATLPNPWRPCKAGEDGEIFYFNFETGVSQWDHPCDTYFRELFEKEKEKSKANKVLGTLHSSLLDSGSVQISVCSIGGNELVAIELPHTELNFKRLEELLNAKSGKELQLLLPDGRALIKQDWKTSLSNILNIHVAKKDVPHCPGCSRPMEWSSTGKETRKLSWECCNVQTCAATSTHMGVHRWFCQECDIDQCFGCGGVLKKISFGSPSGKGADALGDAKDCELKTPRHQKKAPRYLPPLKLKKPAKLYSLETCNTKK